MFCGSSSLVKDSDSYLHIKPCPCRSWPCDDCCPKRVARLQLEIEAGTPDAWLTLTLRHVPGADPIEARAFLAACVKELKKRVWRQYRFRYEHFAVYEATKNGWPHVHIAVRGWQFVLQRRLSALWHDITGDSSIVHVARITAKQVKRYLSKYLGKAPHRFGKSKRYSRSRDWLPDDFGEIPEDVAEQYAGWDHRKESPDELIVKYRGLGWYAHVLGPAEAVMTPPPWSSRWSRGPPRQEGEGRA